MFQQPTAFGLSLHHPSDVAQSTQLLSSIEKSLEASQATVQEDEIAVAIAERVLFANTPSLLLQVVATADYFTSNRSLMNEGLLVDFDISMCSELPL